MSFFSDLLDSLGAYAAEIEERERFKIAIQNQKTLAETQGFVAKQAATSVASSVAKKFYNVLLSAGKVEQAALPAADLGTTASRDAIADLASKTVYRPLTQGGPTKSFAAGLAELLAPTASRTAGTAAAEAATVGAQAATVGAQAAAADAATLGVTGANVTAGIDIVGGVNAGVVTRLFGPAGAEQFVVEKVLGLGLRTAAAEGTASFAAVEATAPAAAAAVFNWPLVFSILGIGLAFAALGTFLSIKEALDNEFVNNWQDNMRELQSELSGENDVTLAQYINYSISSGVAVPISYKGGKRTTAFGGIRSDVQSRDGAIVMGLNPYRNFYLAQLSADPKDIAVVAEDAKKEPKTVRGYN